MRAATMIWQMLLRGFTLCGLLALGGVACSPYPQYQKATHVAKVQLEPARYGEFLQALDATMKPFGLSRFGGGPALNRHVGREVLVADYRTQLSDKWSHLYAIDIVEVGVIQIDVYAMNFKDEKTKRAALDNVNALLSRYGAALQVPAEPAATGKN